MNGIGEVIVVKCDSKYKQADVMSIEQTAKMIRLTISSPCV
jgi:hypothetical protein